jgi:hypothetical protein
LKEKEGADGICIRSLRHETRGLGPTRMPRVVETTRVLRVHEREFQK